MRPVERQRIISAAFAKNVRDVCQRHIAKRGAVVTIPTGKGDAAGIRARRPAKLVVTAA
ncbi:hypothetical protein D3C81_2143650 [compost metagenome]